VVNPVFGIQFHHGMPIRHGRDGQSEEVAGFDKSARFLLDQRNRGTREAICSWTEPVAATSEQRHCQVGHQRIQVMTVMAGIDPYARNPHGDSIPEHHALADDTAIATGHVENLDQENTQLILGELHDFIQWDFRDVETPSIPTKTGCHLNGVTGRHRERSTEVGCWRKN
jgi:hypothetical protein